MGKIDKRAKMFSSFLEGFSYIFALEKSNHRKIYDPNLDPDLQDFLALNSDWNVTNNDILSSIKKWQIQNQKRI